MPRGSAQETPPPAPTPDEIRSGADEILSRPEFQPPPKSLYQRVMDELSERLAEVLELLVRGGRGAVLAWAVLAVVVGGVVFLLVRGLRRDRSRRTGPGTEDVVIDGRRPAADWAAEAARYEAQGQWRDALRCRYRWLIASLAGAGVVEEVPGTTAGEYRTMVGAARPAAAEPISGATDLFERAWYGDEPPGPDEARTFEELATDVLGGGRR